MTEGRNYNNLGYCDITDLENFLLLDIDSSFNTQINDWIAAAEKQVNNYLGYTTASGIMREVITDEKAISHVDADSNLMIFPRKTPIISVEGIDLVKGTSTISLTLTDSDGDTRYNIPTSADYILYPEAEFSLSSTSIITSFTELRGTKFFTQLDYTAGYTTIPADIRQATVNLVADIIMRHANKEGLESIRQGGISKSWFQRNEGKSDFYQDAITLLKPYRQAGRWV